MRCLSVKQPWAELIANGRKTIELRAWATSYRGPILVCASKARDITERASPHGDIDGLSGVAMCLVDLKSVRRASLDDAESAMLSPEDLTRWLDALGPKAMAWEISLICRVNPIPIKGKLSLWSPSADVIDLIMPSPQTRAVEHPQGYQGPGHNIQTPRRAAASTGWQLSLFAPALPEKYPAP